MHQQLAIHFAIQKIYELPESSDAEERAKNLNNIISDSNFKIYLPKEQEFILRQDFYLRGIELADNVKFIPFRQFENVKPEENILLLNRGLLIQMLIDAPIRKKIFEKWILQN